LISRNKWSLGLIIFILFFVFFSFGSFSLSFAQNATGAQEKKDAVKEKESEAPVNLLPSPNESPVPLQTEKLDQAGKMLGKKIDEVGKGASRKVGKWITAKAFWGISWLKLISCLLLLVLVVLVERMVRYFLLRKLQLQSEDKRAVQWWRLFLKALSKPLSLFIRIYGVYWALSPILGYFNAADGSNYVHHVASKVADLGGTVALFWFIYRFVNVVDLQLRKWAAQTESTIDDMLVPLVGRTLRVFILIIGGIMVVQNMTGIEVGPLIASLGIGGLAFALAGKDSIANFLGSLTILLDKPFQVGERIAIDSYDGFVENVGFRSTRVRTLAGHLVSIPNEKIINSTLENIGKRPYLRWQTNLTITYDTPPEKVERAVHIVEGILENHEGMREDLPPRVYFNAFNDWSLNIAVFAWYHPPNYWDYQAWIQKTCLEIMRRFKEEGIEFAFPSQTVYHVNEEKHLELQVLRDKIV
jgi:MscS family membrane protein